MITLASTAFELPLGNAHPISFHQPVRPGRINGKLVAVGFGNPFQIGHLLVRQIGIVPTISVADSWEKTVLR